MAEVDVFPDAEAVAIKHLRMDQTIAQGRVYGKIPSDPQWPIITLHRAGGLPREAHSVDGANIHVDCWAQSKQEARLVAAQARASLMRLQGQTVSVLLDGTVEVGGFVTAVSDAQGPFWLPDPDKPLEEGGSRYFFQVAITLRNHRGVTP